MLKMIMDSFMCKTLTLIFICISLREGCGHPLSDQAEVPAQATHSLVRTKRCSCNSWDDKECIYFCHLDIIWVNTPSKVLPYGLGNPMFRRRRSVDRCKCLNPADKTCSGFCYKSSQNPKKDAVENLGKPEHINHTKLLKSLRSVVKSNTAIAKDMLSSKKNVAGVNRLKMRTRR